MHKCTSFSFGQNPNVWPKSSKHFTLKLNLQQISELNILLQPKPNGCKKNTCNTKTVIRADQKAICIV